MKKLRLLTGALVAGGCVAAQATLYTYDFENINALIPDINYSGYVNEQEVPNLFTLGANDTSEIVNVSVRLSLSGGFNGDLYGYLVGPNGGFAVLLNRVGKTATDVFGYSDAGLTIKLDDGGTYGDIHTYQEVSGYGTKIGDGSSWAPDGRETDPDAVVETDARTALLSSFNGFGADGKWTLFLADVGFGEQSTLVSWGLDIAVVPEPVTWGLLVFAGLAGTRKLFTLRKSRTV